MRVGHLRSPVIFAILIYQHVTPGGVMNIAIPPHRVPRCAVWRGLACLPSKPAGAAGRGEEIFAVATTFLARLWREVVE